MSQSILDTFRSLDTNTKDILADLDSPLSLAFAILEIASNQCKVEKLSAEHITACLEAAGVAVQKKSISNALARAGNRIFKTIGHDGEALYKLMTKGKREISEVLGGESLEVSRIEDGHPRTARVRLAEILSGLKGETRICDPYYGIRTLDSLDNIPKSCNVRFLTAKTSEGGRKLEGALRDFKKERPNVEFRISDNPSGLHDRYLVDNNTLLILGHGLKDIGGKESFIVNLDRSLVSDLIKEIILSFDNRWTKAKPL